MITAFNVVEHKLRDGMREGEMHACLRDVGRLAGGYASTGAISGSELFALEGIAEGLSINKREGVGKWCEAVSFGRSQPVTWEESDAYVSKNDRELDWGDDIGANDPNKYKVVDANWLQSEEVKEPLEWNPVDQLITYLSTLFESDDHVAYTTEAWYKEDADKWLPKSGCFDRTAGELIDELQKCGSDIGAVVGDTNPEVGAWIRFNPVLDGIKNENVTDFRYALVESDSISIERQIAIIKELELPVACVVHSGKKSAHAIVRVDADTYDEYRKRVDFLYEVCDKNGLTVDSSCRNPSRLSRMPGILRNGHKQYLIATNIGKASWKEWDDWIQDINDDLPDIESCEGIDFDNLPELAPELISGVLRQGHKMRIAGPSKAGKSFMLINLAISIAEGVDWLGWQCAKGRVLYVNLELDTASCWHRIANVYKARGIPAASKHNIDVWNLRGKSKPLDQLAPKLIRRAKQKKYTAIIIDPIYKVLTGDENSADAMANFCNQFDKICVELGSAVIDCHHHSKGAQGDKKSSDRASGSGVFARDPDALLDLIELDAKDAKGVMENNAVCDVMSIKMCELTGGSWRSSISMDDAMVEKKFLDGARKILSSSQLRELTDCMAEARGPIGHVTAWRVEGTLREFASFKPRNMWFKYPVHTIEQNVLEDAVAAGSDDGGKWGGKKKGENSKANKSVEAKDSFFTALGACSIDGCPTVDTLAEYLGVAPRTVINRAKKYGYNSEAGQIVKKLDGDN